MKKSFLVDEKGFYGEFGGSYVPEILYATVEKLREQYLPILESKEFQDEYMSLLRDYVGRPSPLYFARRMSERYGCQLYLKREDLNHTGAHKINNTIGQILLAKKMGKKRIIAETGAGQHGVATATVCALMDMPCVVYQGALDVERQHTNVERMKMLGAEVRPVKTGNCIVFGYDPNKTLRVLLVKRRNEPYKDCWAFPGGFMEIDEDLKTCARREVMVGDTQGDVDAGRGAGIHTIGVTWMPTTICSPRWAVPSPFTT